MSQKSQSFFWRVLPAARCVPVRLRGWLRRRRPAVDLLRAPVVEWGGDRPWKEHAVAGEKMGCFSKRKATRRVRMALVWWGWWGCSARRGCTASSFLCGMRPSTRLVCPQFSDCDGGCGPLTVRNQRAAGCVRSSWTVSSVRAEKSPRTNPGAFGLQAMPGVSGCLHLGVELLELDEVLVAGLVEEEVAIAAGRSLAGERALLALGSRQSTRYTRRQARRRKTVSERLPRTMRSPTRKASNVVPFRPRNQSKPV